MRLSVPSPARRRVLVVLAAALAPQPARAAERSFELRIDKNGRVPEGSWTLRVSEGDSVRLVFRVDRPMALHLHGYDIEQRAEPGKPAEIRFVARATGRFPLHAHGGAGASDSPLLYVEVYPR